MAEQDSGKRFNNFQQFLQHALECSDPNCVLPLCINTKLTLKHLQVCRKKVNCSICQEMKSLAAKHSEYCIDYYCRVPFCIEAKLEMFKVKKAAEVHLSDCLDVILQDEKSWGSAQKERVVMELSNTSGSLLAISPSPPSVSQSRNPSAEESPNQNTLTHMPPPGMKKTPPLAAKDSVSHSPPIYNLSSFSNPSRGVCLQQRSRCQSAVTVATERALSQWGGVVEIYPRGPACNQRTLTTSTQPTIQHDLSKVSSPSVLVQERKVSSQESSQITNRKVKQSMDEMNAICPSVSSPVGRTSGASPAMRLSLNSSMGRESKAKNMQSSPLKVRLMNALFGVMHLSMKTKTRAELLICVGSLKSALREFKTLNLA